MDNPPVSRIIAVAIVDDDAEVLSNLGWMIDQADGFRCVGMYANCDALFTGLKQSLPDVILMDIGLPGQSGIECTRELSRMHPDISIVMQTVYSDDEKIFESLRAGAVGYILKKSPIIRILQAVSDAYEGGAPMSGAVARRVLAFFHEPQLEDEMSTLSAREKEVLEALVEGLSYKAISEKLYLSPHTVRFHIHHIYQKLHVRSRGEAMAKVLSHKHHHE